jgi:curved DNA-binding protein CbpA
LGVPFSVDDSTLQSRFRRLAVKYHPDKVRGGDRDRANEHYVYLGHVKDILLNPAKRFAYDRFGLEGIQKCNKCLTIKEFVDNALMTSLGTYGAVFILLFGANALGFYQDGAYWRYLSVLAIATFDIRTAMRPDHPPILTQWLNPLLATMHIRPPYLPFQLSIIITKASISLAQFLGLVIPLLRQDPQQAAKPADDSENARHKQIDRLDACVRASTQEASRLRELESIAFRDHEPAKKELREAMRQYMVQNVVHQEKEVRNAMGQSLARRRANAPHGAVGTK